MCSLLLFLHPDPLIQDLKAEGKGIFGSECARCHSNENIKEFIQKKWIGQSIMDFSWRIRILCQQDRLAHLQIKNIFTF